MNSAERFDRDYFERGVETGVSLYENYHYIPSRSKSEATAFINYMNILPCDSILDFGCAKGFFVRACCDLGYDAYGYDISKYAMFHSEPRNRIFDDLDGRDFDYGFGKDVLEHSLDLNKTVEKLAVAKEWLLIVPLATEGRYRISDYEKDITHLIRYDENEWIRALTCSGLFAVSSFQYHINGLKDKWYDLCKDGNYFIRLCRRD